jgi:hypothetical protein
MSEERNLHCLGVLTTSLVKEFASKAPLRHRSSVPISEPVEVLYSEHISRARVLWRIEPMRMNVTD